MTKPKDKTKTEIDPASVPLPDHLSGRGGWAKTYSKDWCQGFCRKCGSSCADYNEEILRLNAELTQALKDNEELRGGKAADKP